MSEQIKILKPRKALNKAFLKVKPGRTEIEAFKNNLIKLIGKIDEIEREENQKTHLRDFLRDTYYKDSYEINTKDTKDLVIHHGKSNKSDVAVIIEAKRPSNKSEMIKCDGINKRAFHELLLYYLRERISEKNHNIKHLIISNIYEWYVFDEKLFERLFAQNKSLIKQFQVFTNSGKTTEVFYTEIAEPFISELKNDIEFTYFDIREYEKPLRNESKTDDNKLIALFKLLSPEHLLNLPFANDSNSLDKRFYGELLHLIGLTETKQGSKKVIERNKEGQRNTGSLIENAIIQLDSLDKISRLQNPNQFGANTPERLFNVALELSITWINRILFLKLLEGQLITYHKGDKSYELLNSDRIQNYDDLNSLFFQVLARKHNERGEDIKDLFAKVPYLNSSLFEPTDLEHVTLFISNMRDEKTIPIYSQTVLKDDKGKRLTGELSTLNYLFKFLSAYDFSSEGSEEIQEDNKTIINASVLGLIFEKINGYKDGSFFTPGFITMYMCRETIRKAVIQKFNNTKGWNCTDLDSLYDKIEDRHEANTIINDLKICDPAVGSGHFLVSALNEIIAIKNDLKILQDREGRRLKEYHFEVINDELIVTDEDGELFEYNPTSKESQRIQETLFHEKQSIIENCLFGVDINPNSVKICRLRLWIELLKNAYYIQSEGVTQSHALTNHPQLQTLPNIDINIKCGNSLVSRFALDSDLKQALKKSSSKWTIDGYRVAVQTYRNAQNKEQKREMERLINDIKTNFRSEISQNDPKVKRLRTVNGELFALANQTTLFELAKKEKAEWNKKVDKLTAEAKNLEAAIEEIKSNKIYENAFEWRFEFPEVLNNDGDFVGFDVVIGNPPYIRQEELKEFKSFYKTNYRLHTGTTDIYVYFIEKGFGILKDNGVFTYIMPNKFMQAAYGQPARKFLLENNLLEIIDFGDIQVFDEATTYPCILIASKKTLAESFFTTKIKTSDFFKNFGSYIESNKLNIEQSSLSGETWVIEDSLSQELLRKLNKNGVKLESYLGQMGKYGIKTGLTEAFLIDDETRNRIISSDSNSAQLIKPFLLGRDVKPYATTKNKSWLILVPKGLTIKRNLPPDNPNYVSEAMPRYGYIEYDEAWAWFRGNYPGLAEHLIKHKEKAEARTDKGDYWWELRACDYYDKFLSPKIMYQKFQVKPCFILDNNAMYCNDSMWFIPSADKVLLGILNSKIGWWLISKYCTAIQNGYQLIWKYFSQIPIAMGNDIVRKNISDLVNSILSLKKQNPSADTAALESQIDQLVYQLYELTEEEIKIIEGN
ncbi:class I SAM-dependent DNA methyltransferase [Alkalitalea saponilacus]|nr:Eco57I restriction-modification methylase domain-containing protein [Alkalitalea saponilacus]ASB50047.1 type II restriction endonuclease [Alkalitalea saponilacus]